MRKWGLLCYGGAVGLMLVAMACGDNSPTAPTPPPGGGGGGGGGGGTVSSLTLTITSSGLSAPSSDLAVNGTVTITNNDSVPHDIESNPHPAHTDCPGLNFGVLSPGQSRTSGPLTVARSCGVHDHLNPGTQSLRTTIVIR